MGSNSSKIKDFIYVTSESLDPEELHRERVHNPHKEVAIDYKNFVPKKFYKIDAEDEEVEAHLKEVNKKQDLLKQFKHYKDFDRTDYKRMADQAVPFQIFMEQFFKLTIVSSLAFARMAAVHTFRGYFTVASVFRLFIPAVCFSIPAITYRIFTSHQYHIINHEYFRMLSDEVSQYIEFDQRYNLYKDVEDVKYNFKYPKRADFYKVRRPVFDRQLKAQKAQYKEYFEYESGLKKDPIEQFAKSREKQRTGNWEILTEEERKIIEQQIQELKIRQTHHQK